MESTPARPVSANQKKTGRTAAPCCQNHYRSGLESRTGTSGRQIPLQADFLAGSVFSGHDGAFVTVVFHPSDRQGMDSLASGPLRAALEADLSLRSGTPVVLTVRADASVPEPIQEQLEPLPAPPPPSTPEAAPKSQEPQRKPAAPVQETPPRENDAEDSYYTDPLIDAAMEIFRARIISQ
ncbi:MAG: hypothetical protein ACLSUW_03085 [Akkermansia sp.]